jgi:cytochrome P450
MIDAGLPPQLALLEARDLLGPGTNTTSTTLAHILWGLAHDTGFQDGIVGDLESAGWPGDLSALEKLPRLKAAIKEGIRWTAAACAMLPRIVPEEGAILCGHFIPGGVSERRFSSWQAPVVRKLILYQTVLGTNPASYLRDPTAFPSPELYRPERWMNDSSRTTQSNAVRDEFYIPWSKGPSTCIGVQ